MPPPPRGVVCGLPLLVDEFAERTRRSIAQSLELGAKQGLYRADLDIELASVFIAGAYNRYARQLVRSAKKPDLPAVLRKFQRMVIRGITSDLLLAHTLAPTPPVMTRRSLSPSRRRAGSAARLVQTRPRNR